MQTIERSAKKMRFIITLLAFISGGIAGYASDANEVLSEATSRQVKLQGTPQNDGKGVQAYFRVDAIGIKADPFGDWTWHDLDGPAFVSVKSMSSWLPDYMNKSLILEGILSVRVIPKEEVQTILQELLAQLGIEETIAPTIDDLKLYSVERYTWRVNSTAGEQTGAR